MKYLVGDDAIVYDVLSKDDKYPEELDLIFTIGQAEKVIYIDDIQLSDTTAGNMINVLKEFCKVFREDCVTFVLSNKNTVNDQLGALMRYCLQTAGFKSTEELLGNDDNTDVYILHNAFTSAIVQNLQDEVNASMLGEMIRFKDDGRLDLLLARVGEKESLELVEYIKDFFKSDASPKKIEV